MNYYEQDDRKGRIWGTIGVVLYLVVCACVMFVTYRITLPSQEEYILVELSEGEARPDAAPAGSTDSQTATAAAEATSEVEARVVPDPVMTSEEGEPARQVDQRALFRGSTAGGSSAPQEADASRGGNSASSGSGVGGEYSLGGRGLGGDGLLPMPLYNRDEQGRIVIDVGVDREGVVFSAEYNPAGSTIPRGPLSDAAIAAAREAKFVIDESAPERQFGQIIYTFKQTTQ